MDSLDIICDCLTNNMKIFVNCAHFFLTLHSIESIAFHITLVDFMCLCCIYFSYRAKIFIHKSHRHIHFFSFLTQIVQNYTAETKKSVLFVVYFSENYFLCVYTECNWDGVQLYAIWFQVYILLLIVLVSREQQNYNQITCNTTQ